jgi:hypothetical protein
MGPCACGRSRRYTRSGSGGARSSREVTLRELAPCPEPSRPASARTRPSRYRTSCRRAESSAPSPQRHVRPPARQHFPVGEDRHLGERPLHVAVVEVAGEHRDPPPLVVLAGVGMPMVVAYERAFCTLDRRELARGIGRDPDRPRVTNRAGEPPADPPEGVRLKDARALRAGTGFGGERRGEFRPCRDGRRARRPHGGGRALRERGPADRHRRALPLAITAGYGAIAQRS